MMSSYSAALILFSIVTASPSVIRGKTRNGLTFTSSVRDSARELYYTAVLIGRITGLVCLSVCLSVSPFHTGSA